MFVQVNGLRCIDLGDRRSGVEISPARPMNPQVVAGPKMSSTTFAPAAAWVLARADQISPTLRSPTPVPQLVPRTADLRLLQHGLQSLKAD